MKSYKTILAAVAAILLTGFATGCNDTFEEISELSLGRCLQPLNLSAKVTDGQTVTFGWDVTKDAEVFILEVFDDQEMTSLVFAEEVAPSQVPVTKYLDVDKTYYFRVAARSGKKDDSKWAVYQKSIKTFAVKSNLYMEVSGREATSVSLVWTADPEVDRIEYAAAGTDEYASYTLTAEDIESGTATVTGLAPSTEYDIILYFSSANRGQVDVWTMPDPQGLVRVSTDAALAQAIADGANILLTMEGSPYTLGADIAIGYDTPKAFKIYGEGSVDGTRPVIYGTVSLPDGFAGGDLYFEGVEFNGKENTCGFLIQHKNGATEDGLQVNSIIYRNCVITGYSKGLFYEWGKTVKVGEFTFDSCDIHAVNGDGSGGGDGFDLRNPSEIASLNFVNNTIYTGFRTFLRIDATPVIGDVTFDFNTVMNLCFVDNTNNGGIIGFQTAPSSFSLKNNLFINMTEKATLTNANTKYISGDNLNLSAASNYFFNVTEDFFTANFTLAMAAGEMLESDPCFNAKGGIFNILASSEISGKKVGAPKWWSEYVEAPEDLTLTTVEGSHTWDFGNAVYFSSDFTKSKVRDQLLFGVTANKILLDEGELSFTAAAVTTRKGVPTDGYLAFQVNKPGSVVLRPADANNLGNHLVVGVGPLSGGSITIKGGAAAMSDMGGTQKILVKDVTEESLVYVFPSGPVNLAQLAWSSDTSAVNTSLPAPAPEAKPTTVTAGEPEDVTVTWEKVENAASYSVVFSGKTYAVEEGESYTIASNVVGMLDPGSYRVEVYANPGRNDIYNTMSEAGVACFAVQPAGGEEPSGGLVVSSVDELLTAIDAGKDAITLKYSDSPYEIGQLTLSTPLHLSGQTEGGKKTPVIASITLSGDIKGEGHGSVILDNLDITNDGTLSVLIEDKTNAPTIDTVAILNCDIHGTKALYDNSGKAASDAQVLIFRGNLVENCSDGADFIDLRTGAHHSVSIVNNTFANSCRTFIRTDAVHELNYLTVRNNTFYKVATNSSSKDNNGIFHVRSTGGAGLLEYKVLNNLFYSILIEQTPSNAAGFPKFRSKGGLDPVTVVNNYFYNCEDREEMSAYSFWAYFTKEAATAGNGAILPSDPCKDAANGDYTLTNGVVMNANVGDPRWNPMRGSVPTSEITVKSTDEFLTAIAAGKSTITLAAGSYDLTAVDESYTEVANGKISLVNSLNLIGEQGSELIGGFIFKAGVGKFTATGMTFNGNATIDNVFEVVEEAVEISSFSVKNSTVKDYKNRLFYMGQNAHVASIEFSRNIISGSAGADFTSGDFIDIRKGTANAVQFNRNTVSNAVRTFVRCDAAVVLNSIRVENNTFYNLCYVDSKDNNGIFHVRATSLDESAYIVRNNIFAGMHRASETPAQANGYPKLVSTNTASKIPTFSHNYFNDIDTLSSGYNFWTKDRVTEATATAGYGIVLAETPFKDAANGDFTLVSPLAASENVGDPRWNENASRYVGTPFECANLEELLMAIAAGKKDILLTGSEYDFLASEDASIATGVLQVSGDLSIKGKLSHGVKPTVTGGFKLLATDGGLVLDNLHITGTKLNPDDTKTTIGNLIDIDASAVLSKITLKDNDIENFGNRLISGSGDSSCGPVTLFGNYVTGFGTGGDFIDFRKGKVSSIKVVGNTFANGIRTFLRCDAAVVCGAINVENNTFYNLGSVDSKDNNGILHVRSSSATSNPRQIIVKKNIFAAMHRAVETPANTAAGFPHLISKTSAAIAVPTITDNIFFDFDDHEDFGWWKYLPEGNEDAKERVLTESPFVDPSGGKYTVISAYKGYGDFRW
ncbi:MAG: DUF5123 domain-containing protein [Candidatus Cryptobacteroides sp.]